jgi:hypothetical protein
VIPTRVFGADVRTRELFDRLLICAGQQPLRRRRGHRQIWVKKKPSPLSRRPETTGDLATATPTIFATHLFGSYRHPIMPLILHGTALNVSRDS